MHYAFKKSNKGVPVTFNINQRNYHFSSPLNQSSFTRCLCTLCFSSAPPLSGVTTSPQPLRTTTTTTTTTAHWGAANTTTTTGLREGSRGVPRPPPVIPQTTSPPPLESFPLPERFCEATENRDIEWPQTQRGMLVERPCPKGTRGKHSSSGQCALCFQWPEASQENVSQFFNVSDKPPYYSLSVSNTISSQGSGTWWCRALAV